MPQIRQLDHGKPRSKCHCHCLCAATNRLERAGLARARLFSVPRGKCCEGSGRVAKLTTLKWARVVKARTERAAPRARAADAQSLRRSRLRGPRNRVGACWAAAPGTSEQPTTADGLSFRRSGLGGSLHRDGRTSERCQKTPSRAPQWNRPNSLRNSISRYSCIRAR